MHLMSWIPNLMCILIIHIAKYKITKIPTYSYIFKFFESYIRKYYDVLKFMELNDSFDFIITVAWQSNLQNHLHFHITRV